MACTEQLTVAARPSGPDGAVIYVLVDALGWEVLRDRPFLNKIVKERRRVETILGYSSGAIPSLLTGMLPSEHGHWNLFYRSPDTSPFRWTAPLLLLPSRIREGRVVRRLVKGISRRLSGYSGYFTIYNLPLKRIRFYDICETTDIYSPGGLAPAQSIFDVFQQAGVAYECFNYHRYTDAQALDEAIRRLQDSNSRVYFIYLSGLDAFLHFNISDRAAVSAKLAWYEAGLQRIYQVAESRFGHARLHVFSDHGMTPIVETRDLIPEVDRLGLKIPEDYLPVYDSTMARFWMFSERAQRGLSDMLGGLPFGRVLPPEELAELGLAFADDRYGHLIFLMNPGVLICPSDMGRIRFDGMHGFHPREDAASHAVLLSSEPLPRPVNHITDIFPMVLEDLRLADPARPNGFAAQGAGLAAGGSVGRV